MRRSLMMIIANKLNRISKGIDVSNILIQLLQNRVKYY